jgi:hypothetical protein
MALLSLPAWAAEEWQPGWSYPGVVQTGVGDGSVRALLEHDDGSGASLFVAGGFNIAGTKAINSIARWDGASWSPVGSSGYAAGPGRALAVFGGDLYVGGQFGVMRWDGSAWSGLGAGVDGEVLDLEVHDDGTGAALYAAGNFFNAGGTAARGLARWNGSAWSAVGGSLNGGANALTSFDDGTGVALYVGGQFTLAGGVPAMRVAKWAGGAWTALGAGMNNTVTCLAVFDAGLGPRIVAGGLFTSADGVPADRIAVWDAESGAWAALSGGVGGPVNALFVDVDETSRQRLLVGGLFTTAGGVAVDNVAVYDDGWSAIAGTNGGVLAFARYDDGTGPCVFAGGTFPRNAGNEIVNNVARLEGAVAMPQGSVWLPLGNGMGGLTAPSVNALATGFCPCGAVYAGGTFSQAGGAAASGTQKLVADWDGVRWRRLGVTGFNNTIRALYVDQVAAVPDSAGACLYEPITRGLYAGGDFSSVDGMGADGIAVWDGQQWGALGSGPGFAVTAIGSFGLEIVAGGINGGVKRWDGTNWSHLDGPVNGTVWTMAPFHDGAATELYIGGDFTMAGGMNAVRIVKWNGTDFVPLFPGLLGVNGPVHAMATFGGQLYIGGIFSQVGNVAASNIARFDGSVWSAVGGGTNGAVYALTNYRDALYVGGAFTLAGGAPASNLAKWDGGWSNVAGGANGPIRTLAAGGPLRFDLYAGGGFTSAGGIDAAFVATFGGPAAFQAGSEACPAPAATGVPTPWDLGAAEPPTPHDAGTPLMAGLSLGGGRAAFALTLSRGADVTIDVYDTSGRRVATLANGSFDSGLHRVPFGSGSARGGAPASGVYLGLARVRWPDGGSASAAARVLVVR